VKATFTTQPEKKLQATRCALAPSPCLSIANAIKDEAAMPIPVPSSADAPARDPHTARQAAATTAPSNPCQSTTLIARRRPCWISALLKASHLRPGNKKATACAGRFRPRVAFRSVARQAMLHCTASGRPQIISGLFALLQCSKG